LNQESPCMTVGECQITALLDNKLRDRGLQVETGKFGAMMQVAIENDDPVTLLLEVKREFRVSTETRNIAATRLVSSK
jgi:D-Tyr-tRNA(Tyr) deacylase